MESDMGRKLVYATFILFALVFIAGIVGLGFIVLERQDAGTVPGNTIIEADFTGGLVEYVPEDPIAKALFGQQPTLRGTLVALERAAEDERVTTLVARVGTGFRLPGRVQELRDAILHFRSRGKHAIAYVETFGFGYSGATNYYLASAFDEIHLLPIGQVTLAGLALEVQFLRGALDKLGIEPQMESRWEYKTAKQTYTNTALDEPGREAYERLLESQFEQIAADIASARGLTAEAINEIAAHGTFDADEALEVGLIDGIAYRDEVFALAEERAREAAGERDGSEAPDPERLYLGSYLARSTGPDDDAPVIALVYGVGTVVQGESQYDPLTGSVTMGSDSVAAALRAAAADEEVRAILFRVDSGGGSAVASQIMWRETLRAQQKGVPVIVSMGDVAGSGGYFIAMGADKIVAQPGTITGSIGVVGGKLVTKQFWDKVGITFDPVETHPNAAMWSSSQAFTPEQWEVFGSWLDRIYGQFTEGVAEGRNMPIEQVLEVSKGRIWTGSDALEIGLVDALGGFPVAIRLAKEAAEIPEDDVVRLRVFPRTKTPVELVMERLIGRDAGENSGDAATALLVDGLRRVQPLGRAAAALGLTPHESALHMQLPYFFTTP
jgi:protease-4